MFFSASDQPKPASPDLTSNMLAARFAQRSALLNKRLAITSVRHYTADDATYHRDPETGMGYNDQGFQVMLNDADIAKHWPSVHTKIHLHKQQAFDHVNTMNSGHYADSATYFAYLTYAAVLWNIIVTWYGISCGKWD